MALYIKFDSGNDRVWNTGQEPPLIFNEIEAVKVIQADGDELDKILTLFGAGYHKQHVQDVNFTIPVPFGRRVVAWHGDIAKTIISNLF